MKNLYERVGRGNRIEYIFENQESLEGVDAEERWEGSGSGSDDFNSVLGIAIQLNKYSL